MLANGAELKAKQICRDAAKAQRKRGVLIETVECLLLHKIYVANMLPLEWKMEVHVGFIPK